MSLWRVASVLLPSTAECHVFEGDALAFWMRDDNRDNVNFKIAPSGSYNREVTFFVRNTTQEDRAHWEYVLLQWMAHYTQSLPSTSQVTTYVFIHHADTLAFEKHIVTLWTQWDTLINSAGEPNFGHRLARAGLMRGGATAAPDPRFVLGIPEALWDAFYCNTGARPPLGEERLDAASLAAYKYATVEDPEGLLPPPSPTSTLERMLMEEGVERISPPLFTRQPDPKFNWGEDYGRKSQHPPRPRKPPRTAAEDEDEDMRRAIAASLKDAPSSAVAAAAWWNNNPAFDAKLEECRRLRLENNIKPGLGPYGRGATTGFECLRCVLGDVCYIAQPCGHLAFCQDCFAQHLLSPVHALCPNDECDNDACTFEFDDSLRRQREPVYTKRPRPGPLPNPAAGATEGWEEWLCDSDAEDENYHSEEEDWEAAMFAEAEEGEREKKEDEKDSMVWNDEKD